MLSIPSTTGVSSSVCRDISVLDDMIAEDSETFTVTVETATPNDMIMGPTTAIVTIADDDGKYYVFQFPLNTVQLPSDCYPPVFDDDCIALISHYWSGSFQLRVADEIFPAVDEFVGNVQACVQLTTSGSLGSDVIVNIETMDDSAIGNVNTLHVQ